MYVFKAFANQKKKIGIFLQCFFKNSEVLERSRAPVFGHFLNMESQDECVSQEMCVKSV